MLMGLVKKNTRIKGVITCFDKEMSGQVYTILHKAYMHLLKVLENSKCLPFKDTGDLTIKTIY